MNILSLDQIKTVSNKVSMIKILIQYTESEIDRMYMDCT